MSPERRQLLARLNDALSDPAAGNFYTFDDLVELARARRVQIHHRNQAIAVTEILTHPQGVELNLIACAGTLRDVLALEPDIEELARAHDARRMVTHGRPAWRRIAERLGWYPSSLQFVKPILPHNPKEGSA
jgi:hypothetical protein